MKLYTFNRGPRGGIVVIAKSREDATRFVEEQPNKWAYLQCIPSPKMWQENEIETVVYFPGGC